MLSGVGTQTRILIAGVGNVLLGDDGFGVEVARRLAGIELPPGVRLVETGIGGIALIHELADGFDVLVVADAVDRGRAPGTIMIIDPDIVDVGVLSPLERRDQLADMHVATPERVFVLARALGTLPPRVIMVACQPLDATSPHDGLSQPVAAAVEAAVDEILQQVASLVAPRVS
ncbi:MAG: hydrogenase maturation protease [Actinomycetota bacterium]|nr:hydrogenase maturation protease [Actinomycetota bacterium]